MTKGKNCSPHLWCSSYAPQPKAKQGSSGQFKHSKNFTSAFHGSKVSLHSSTNTFPATAVLQDASRSNMYDTIFPVSALINSDTMACPDNTTAQRSPWRELYWRCQSLSARGCNSKYITLNNSQGCVLIAAGYCEGRHLRDSYFFVKIFLKNALLA